MDNAGAGQNLELLILISGGQRSMENNFFFFLIVLFDIGFFIQDNRI